MRRWMTAGILCLMAIAAFGQIDPTLARIKLTRVEVITVKQFQNRVAELEKQLKQPFSEETKKKLLEGMINDKLLLQAAERAEIVVSQVDVNNAISAYLQQYGVSLGLGRPLTEAELKALFNQQSVSWETFINQITNQIKLERLVTLEQKSYFEAIQEPTEEEIKSYYESNRTKYPIVSPEMVRFKQIRIATQGLSVDDVDRARGRADDIYLELQNGASFDKFLEVYLENGKSVRIGGLVYETWRRDDEQRKVSFGDALFGSLFEMGEGQISQVIESNFGFHIIEVIEKIPFTILSLDDKIPPQNQITIRQFIANGLRQSRQGETMEKAMIDLIARLREEAEIQIMDKNFPS